MNIRPEIREKTIKCCMNTVLKSLMHHNDMGQMELAKILGVPFGRVKSWLERERPKADWELFRCAEYFRVPISFLVYGIWEESYSRADQNDVLKMIDNYEDHKERLARINQGNDYE